MLISDYSLLLAIGFVALSIVVILAVTWISTRAEPFLLTWVAGTAVVLCSAFGFAAYGMSVSPWGGFFAFGAMVAGTGLGLGAAVQFRTGRLPFLVLAPLVLVALLVVANPMLAGDNGISIMFAEGIGALFLAATAVEYWRARAEAPKTLAAMALLNLITGLMLAMSSAVLVLQGEAVLTQAPRNWSETLGRAVTVLTMVGMAAIVIVLNHWRIQRRTEQGRRDPLTGLLNRKALVEIYERPALLARSALIVFGLDDFKEINETRGGAAGDEVVRRFVSTLARAGGDSGVAARLADDEFAFVLPNSSLEAARDLAEAVRSAFAAESIPVGKEMLRRKVSAGVAFAGEPETSFEDVLRTASAALSAAKRDGRNRVVAWSPQIAGLVPTAKAGPG